MGNLLDRTYYFEPFMARITWMEGAFAERHAVSARFRVIAITGGRAICVYAGTEDVAVPAAYLDNWEVYLRPGQLVEARIADLTVE